MRYSLVIIVVVCFISIGCASSIVQPPRETVTFDYAPKTEASPGSADVNFGLVGVQFVIISPTSQLGIPPQASGIVTPELPPPLFLQLVSNMTRDFEEVLTARGFGIKGSFETFDEMIYPDKEGSDLVLTARVKFSADTSRIGYKPNFQKSVYGGCGCSGLFSLVSLTAASSGHVNPRLMGVVAGGGLVLGILSATVFHTVMPEFVPVGSVVVSSEINLEAYESLTKELMWSKKIPIPPFTVQPKVILRKKPNLITWQRLMEIDNEFYSNIAKAFENQYEKTLNQIYTYLDPREMAIVKNQAMELRKRKVF